MGMFGDFNNKKNKKQSKEEQAKKSQSDDRRISSWTLPQPEVIGRGKKKDF